MKLCFYSNVFAPSVGGIEVTTEMLAEWFARRGAAVTVVTETPAHGPEPWRPYAVARRPGPGTLPRIFAAHDLVHVNGMSVRAVLAARCARLPVLVTHQTYNAQLPRDLRSVFAVAAAEGPLRLLHAAASAAVLRLVQRNVSISAWLSQCLRLPRCRIIANPVHPRFRPAPEVKPGNRFCFVGRLVADKGCDLLLEALAHCARRGQRFEADIYGDGPERSRLQTLARTLGLTDQVAFHGAVQGEALPEVYRRSLALVVPSRWPEPLGIVALEAMACGRAVIGSAAGGLGEVLCGVGLQFPNGDAVALSHCLERIAADAALRSELEARSLVRARSFSLEHIAGCYHELYQELLAETRRRAGRFGRRGVLVAHPGTQHSLETARGLAQAGLLRRYYTSLYIHPRWFRLLRTTVNGRASGHARRLEKRHSAELAAGLVATRPLLETLYLSSAHLPIARPLAEPLLRWRNERFDAYVAQRLAQERPAVVLGYDTSALRTFQRARQLGIRCVLDQTIGHLRTAAALYREEAELHPDFADSLPPAPPDWLIERCTHEALLADCVLAPSEYVRNTLTAIGVADERIVLLPYGADTARFAPAPSRTGKPFRLLFVGQLSQRKGLKYLLEAFVRLRLPDAELVLVGPVLGSGDGLRRYREYFRHVPPIPQTGLPAWYAQADVFVYPSLHEGSALAIYEALASGLPVITTPNSGSVVRDGLEGFLVPIRNVPALAERILFLYENPELRRELARRARARAEQFSWTLYRQRLAAVLSRLAGSAAVEGRS
jgi:glycosyltransferase involved in cell wall biosynthesis